MAEKLTDKGLVVGLIPDDEQDKPVETEKPAAEEGGKRKKSKSAQ